MFKEAKKFHPKDRVRVAREATYAVRILCDKLGTKSLLGTVMTEQDPCCDCYIVQFDRFIATDSVFYTDGKKGYCDEVKPEDLKASKAGPAAWRAESTLARPPREDVPAPPGGGRKLIVGDRVRVTLDYDSAKVGMVGVIVKNPGNYSKSYGIRFDSLTAANGGHNLGGDLTGSYAGKGHYVPPTHLELTSAAGPTYKPAEKPAPSLLETLGKDAVIRKVNFDLKSTAKTTEGKEVGPGSRYYGWLAILPEDGNSPRKVVFAPFGEWGWFIAPAEAPIVENLRKYSF